MPPRDVEQRRGADDIRVDEIAGRIDRAIDVRFRGEIHHRIKRVFFEKRLHPRLVRNVRVEEFVTLAVRIGDAREVRGIARVRERIDIRDERRPVMLQHVADEIAADKTAAAGNEKSHKRARLLTANARRRYKELRRSPNGRRLVRRGIGHVDFLVNAQAADGELVDVQLANPRAADEEAADRDGADGERADRQRPERERAERLRADGKRAHPHGAELDEGEMF